MSYLQNKYAGMRFVGRPDSWYEPDDEPDWDVAREIVAAWIDENTTIPETSLSDDDLDPIVREYVVDPEVLNDGLAQSLQESWNEYCETNHELGKPR